jgi:hypothetical protein
MTVNVLLILNDLACGTERSYNVLRLAGSLAKRDGVDVRVASRAVGGSHVLSHVHLHGVAGRI